MLHPETEGWAFYELYRRRAEHTRWATIVSLPKIIGHRTARLDGPGWKIGPADAQLGNVSTRGITCGREARNGWTGLAAKRGSDDRPLIAVMSKYARPK